MRSIFSTFLVVATLLLGGCATEPRVQQACVGSACYTRVLFGNGFAHPGHNSLVVETKKDCGGKECTRVVSSSDYQGDRLTEVLGVVGSVGHGAVAASLRRPDSTRIQVQGSTASATGGQGIGQGGAGGQGIGQGGQGGLGGQGGAGGLGGSATHSTSTTSVTLAGCGASGGACTGP
jgi:hypothetical protein